MRHYSEKRGGNCLLSLNASCAHAITPNFQGRTFSWIDLQQNLEELIFADRGFWLAMTILMWAPHEQGHTLFMAQSKVLAHAETGGLLRWLPKPTKKLECSYRGTVTFARESQRFGIQVGLVQSNRDLRTKCKVCLARSQ